jgi:hypothetical protein
MRRDRIGVLSVNILRICLILIFIGLFLPICFKSTGFQTAEGILGSSHYAKEAIFLAPVEDTYGYLLFGVFALAAVGLLVSFFSNNFFAPFIFFATSLVFTVILLMHFKIYFNFNDLSFYIRIIFPIKLNLLPAGYGMVAGFVVGVFAFFLRLAGR